MTDGHRTPCATQILDLEFNVACCLSNCAVPATAGDCKTKRSPYFSATLNILSIAAHDCLSALAL